MSKRPKLLNHDVEKNIAFTKIEYAVIHQYALDFHVTDQEYLKRCGLQGHFPTIIFDDNKTLIALKSLLQTLTESINHQNRTLEELTWLLEHDQNKNARDLVSQGALQQYRNSVLSASKRINSANRLLNKLVGHDKLVNKNKSLEKRYHDIQNHRSE